MISTVQCASVRGPRAVQQTAAGPVYLLGRKARTVHLKQVRHFGSSETDKLLEFRRLKITATP